MKVGFLDVFSVAELSYADCTAACLCSKSPDELTYLDLQISSKLELKVLPSASNLLTIKYVGFELKHHRWAVTKKD